MVKEQRNRVNANSAGKYHENNKKKRLQKRKEVWMAGWGRGVRWKMYHLTAWKSVVNMSKLVKYWKNTFRVVPG